MSSINEEKKKFILQFILEARRSGRGVDTDGEHHRRSIVEAASDLYDKTLEASTPQDQPK